MMIKNDERRGTGVTTRQRRKRRGPRSRSDEDKVSEDELVAAEDHLDDLDDVVSLFAVLVAEGVLPSVGDLVSSLAEAVFEDLHTLLERVDSVVGDVEDLKKARWRCEKAVRSAAGEPA